MLEVLQRCIYNKLLEQKLDKDLPGKCPHHGQEQSLDVGKKGKLLAQQIKGRPLKRFTLEAINGTLSLYQSRDRIPTVGEKNKMVE